MEDARSGDKVKIFFLVRLKSIARPKWMEKELKERCKRDILIL